MTFSIIILILKILSITIPLLISVAYFTVAERKIMGAIQRRRGPNVIGFIGLLQAFADGLKLFVKETTLPSNSNIIIFFYIFFVLIHPISFYIVQKKRLIEQHM
jgi:NADH-quinone oxidoreductase subunit H